MGKIKRSRAEGRAREHLDSEDLEMRASKYSRSECLDRGIFTNLGDNSLFGLVVISSLLRKAQAKIGGCGEGDREEKSGGWSAGA